MIKGPAPNSVRTSCAHYTKLRDAASAWPEKNALLETPGMARTPIDITGRDEAGGGNSLSGGGPESVVGDAGRKAALFEQLARVGKALGSGKHLEILDLPHQPRPTYALRSPTDRSR
jgi:hypothetical protein